MGESPESSKSPESQKSGGLVNPAGGVFYHYLAFKYRSNLWREYVSSVERFLIDWSPPEKKIVLFGPSGGYSLPAAFLERFETWTAYDPDPLAAYIFRKRFRKSLKGRELIWRRENLFSKFEFEKLRICFMENRDSCFLFCNLLGQLAFLHPSYLDHPRFRLWKQNLKDFLKDPKECLASWASYHDILTSPSRLNLDSIQSVEQAMDLDELAQRLFSEKGSIEKVEIVDHSIADLFYHHPVQNRGPYFQWELSPGSFHLIEAMRFRTEKNS